LTDAEHEQVLGRHRHELLDGDPCPEFSVKEALNPRHRSIACPVCRGRCEDYPAYGLSLCYFCHHTFQTDLAVAVSYDATYAHQYDHRPVREMSNLRWTFIQSTLGLPAASRILDVGYGNGAFLKRARAADMAIFGVDLHNEDFGVPVVDFDTPQDYDLVCFFDSLEHFPDFAPILRLRARNVVVSIPYTPDFILTAPTKWRHFKPGEHLHYFSRSSLDMFMRDWGFPERLAEGYPEDDLRGKLIIDGRSHDNIYTAIYTCT
jgi:hypothetical protein